MRLKEESFKRFVVAHFYLLFAAAVGCGCGARGVVEKADNESLGAGSIQEQRVFQEIPDGRALIVALGDSLTAGRGVDPRLNYPSELQKKIDDAGYPFRVINEGVSGDTSAQGLNRLGAVRALNPAIVIVDLGANDGLRGMPLEEIRANLDEIIGTLRSDGITVVLAGMQMPPNMGTAYTRAYAEIFPALATKHRVPLIPFLLDGVAGRPELNQEDGIHPTEEGYEIVAENVWEVLSPLLR